MTPRAFVKDKICVSKGQDPSHPDHNAPKPPENCLFLLLKLMSTWALKVFYSAVTTQTLFTSGFCLHYPIGLSISKSQIFSITVGEGGSYIYCQLLNKNPRPLRCSWDNIEYAVIVPSQYQRCCHWYRPQLSLQHTRYSLTSQNHEENSIFYFPPPWQLLLGVERDWLWPGMIQWTMADWRNAGLCRDNMGISELFLLQLIL